MLGIVIVTAEIFRPSWVSTAVRSCLMTVLRRPTSGDAGRPMVSRARRTNCRPKSAMSSATLLYGVLIDDGS